MIRCTLWGLVVWLAVGSTAAAQPPVFYSGGQAWPLIKSDTELAVRPRPGADVGRLRGELARRNAEMLAAPRRTRLQVAAVDRADEAAVDDLARTPGVDLVTYVYRFTPDGPPVLITDEVVVGFENQLDEDEVLAFCDEYGAELVRPIEGLKSTYVLRMYDGYGDAAVRTAAAMYEDPRTRFSHPDAILGKKPAEILDPLYLNQWHLNNIGQSGGTAGADIDAPEAWATTEGSGAVVAIYDDAIDVGHPDLPVATWKWDYAGADDNPSPAAAGENHGTAVAGVAVAQANDLLVRGSAPLAGLIAQRWGGPTSDDAQAILDASTQGADVHSNSWSYSKDPNSPPPPVPDAVANAIRTVTANGMLVIFAAGNESGPIADNSLLAAMPETLAVGASTNFDQHAYYSNTGLELDLVAPSNGGSAGIWTTDVRDGLFPTNGYAPNDYCNDFGGTSSATPLVAGAAALCRAVDPALTATQLRAVLEHTCDQIGTGYDATTSHSNTFGYGRLNAASAVQAVSAGQTWPDHVSDLSSSYSAGKPRLDWDNPPDDVTTVMIVRSASAFTFRPTDSTNYSVGQTVAAGVQVASNSAGTSFEDTSAPDDSTLYYAVFVRNAANRWSWGTKKTVGAAPPPTVTALNISGPTSLDEGDVGQFVALATFSNSSTVDVTDEAEWNAGPAALLVTTSTPGRVQAQQVDRDGVGWVTATYTDSQSNIRNDAANVQVSNVPVNEPNEPNPPDDPPPSGGCGGMAPMTPVGMAAGLLMMAGIRRRRFR
ncbi:MAG TPA: S8 family serine peptidase [Phycisphaerae bacterium]|nr:S8 family serine peptidase [Phycisphaerae bacterium]